MRLYRAVVLLAIAAPAAANTTPEIAPPPSWVVRVPLKPAVKPSTAPIRVLLRDEQVRLDRGAITRFNETAVQVLTAEGLSEGNIAVNWRPDVDRLTVHDLKLIRGGRTIDVLASQKFKVIQRETQLEQATLDGRLTATLIIEGVQVGDIIDFANTVETRDPVMAGHVEAITAQWNGVPIEQAHAKVHWAPGLPVRFRALGDLTGPTKDGGPSGGDWEISRTGVEPLVGPTGAPVRYGLGRFIELTDYRDRSEVAALFVPLFARAETVDPKGALNGEIEAIARASSDPVVRAEAALKLVQERIRYVSLSMGEAGLVPAGADATWASRLGDCKAKTAMLLAILHRLGIVASPVLVQTVAGDALPSQLPMISMFDHVLVRATIGGHDYWLDGTRTGDTHLSKIQAPTFRWGLPLVPRQSELVKLETAPRSQPDKLVTLDIDASNGAFASAKVRGEMLFRFETALALRSALASVSEAQRDEALRRLWKSQLDTLDVERVTASYDETEETERLVVDGHTSLAWDDVWYRVPLSSLAFKADFSRPEGPGKDAPFQVAYPWFLASEVTVRLPKGIELWSGKIGHDVDETLAGVAYHREATLKDGVFRMKRSERALQPEIDSSLARSAEARLRALDSEDVQLRIGNYLARDADLAALAAKQPEGASGYFRRGLYRLNRGLFADAIADFDQADRLEPKNAETLANRGVAYMWIGKPSEASADFAAVKAISPRHAVVARGEAMLAFQRGDQRAAVAGFTEALTLEPDNIFSLRRRSAALANLGEFEKSLADLDRVIKLQPSDFDAYVDVARVLRRAGKQKDIPAEARTVERLAPKDPRSHIAASAMYLLAEQRGQALAALDEGIALKPDSELYVRRAFTRDANDFAGRAADIDAAIKLAPNDLSLDRFKADLQVERKDYALAIATYSAILTKNPGDLSIRNSRGIANELAGNAEAARADFAAVDREKAEPDMSNSICWSRATAGVALNEALKQCDRAIAGMPLNPAYLDSRAFVRLRLGNLDAAIKDYDAALAIEPLLSSSLYGRALAFTRKGEMARAEADRTSAIRSSPAVVESYRRYGMEWPAGKRAEISGADNKTAP